MNDLGHYLAPDSNTFWDWNASGEAVHWWNGQTLALYEELDLLIREMQPHGLPRFEELLLVLAATRRNWSEADGQASFFLGKVNALDPQGWKDFPIFQWLKPLCDCLNEVQTCARRAGYGTEVSRALVKFVFVGEGDALESDDAAAVRDAFVSGEVSIWARNRDRVNAGGNRNPPLALLQTVRNLVELLQDIDPATDVKALLKTGLPGRVEAAELEDLPFSERVGRLLAQLEEEGDELSGLARVAKHLSAVIHLPRRLNDPSDQPVGGYSDVSNRGNIDRLLVSELAQDPDVLAVRVALKEALYLRRESPPEEPASERHILIDTGVRMWGVPRIYAYGVALAFAADTFAGRETFVYTHERDSLVPAEMDHREGLEKLMARLSPDPDPGAALPGFFAGTERIEGGADCVLITTERVWRDRRFRIALGDRRPQEFFVALVDRAGWLKLLQVNGAGERELKRLRLDIDSLLAGEGRRGRRNKLLEADADLPKFLQLDEAPLRFAPQISPDRAAFHHEAGLLGHTADGLLYLWKRPDMGALLLTTEFPKGSPFWTQIDNDQREAVFLFNRGGTVLVYRIGLDTNVASAVEIVVVQTPQFVHRLGEVLIFFGGRNAFAYRMHDGRCVGRTTLAGICNKISDHFVRIGDTWFAMRLSSLETGKVATGKTIPLNAENTHFLKFESVPARDALYVWSNAHWPEPLVARTERTLTPLEENARVIARVDGEVAGLSSDKERLFVKATDLSPVVGYAVDVMNDAQYPLYGDWSVFDLEPEAARLRAAVPVLRKKFSGVILSVSGNLHLVTHKRRLLSLRLEGSQVKRLVWREGPMNLGLSTRLSADFEECELNFLGRFGLKVAEFPEGSRLFLDRRGLLHLKSGDPDIPEVSVVLKEGETSGWCSNGDRSGSVYFISQRESRAGSVYAQIEKMIARIVEGTGSEVST